MAGSRPGALGANGHHNYVKVGTLGGWPTFAAQRLRLPHASRGSKRGHHGPRPPCSLVAYTAAPELGEPEAWELGVDIHRLLFEEASRLPTLS